MVDLRKSTKINIVFKYLQLFMSVVGGILLVPIYLRYLTADQYGAWLTVGSVVVWLAAFDPGVANLLIQRIGQASGASDRRAVHGYIYAGLFCSGIVSMLVTLTGYLAASFVVPLMGVAGQSLELMIYIFRIAALTTGLMIFGYSLTGSSLGLHRSWEVGVILLGASCVKIAVVLIFLKCGIGILALPYADLAAALWVVVLGFPVLWLAGCKVSPHERSIGFERLGELVGLFVFSLGARLGKVVTRNLDNIFIARSFGPEFVAVYSLTATAPRQSENIINLPVSAFRPSVAHLWGEGNLPRVRSHLSRLISFAFWGLGMIMAGLLAFNDDFVSNWVGNEKFAGANVCVVLCLVFFVRAWSNAFGTLGFCLGDIRRNSLIEWVSSLLLLPAVVFGVKFWGLLGAAMAHVVVALFTTCWYFPFSLFTKARFSNYEIYNLFLVLIRTAICSTVCGLGFSLIPIKGWFEFLLASIFLVAFFLGLNSLFCEVFRKEAIRGVLSLLSQLKTLRCVIFKN